MTRGMRLMIVFCLFIGVIVLMMDCAKKTMKQKQHHGEDGTGDSQGWYFPESGTRPASAPG